MRALVLGLAVDRKECNGRSSAEISLRSKAGGLIAGGGGSNRRNAPHQQCRKNGEVEDVVVAAADYSQSQDQHCSSAGCRLAPEEGMPSF